MTPAPLRGFMSEPVQYRALFLPGDTSLRAQYGSGNCTGLTVCSQKALARVWQVMRFFGSATPLMHQFPEHSEFDRQTQQGELSALATTPGRAAAVCAGR